MYIEQWCLCNIQYTERYVVCCTMCADRHKPSFPAVHTDRYYWAKVCSTICADGQKHCSCGLYEHMYTVGPLLGDTPNKVHYRNDLPTKDTLKGTRN